MADALDLAVPGLGAVAGVVQSLIEGGKAKKANRELDSLFKQRKKYQTPKEVFDILNLTTSNAAQGFSDETNAYLTGQAGAGLSGALGTAGRLGADPNQLSSLLDSYYGDIFRIGNENELVKMKKFDSLTNAINLVGENKSAEWQSEDNLLKDRMQAVASRVGKAEIGLNSGLNLAFQSLVNFGSMGLYDSKTPAGSRPASATTSGGTVASGGAAGRTPSEILADRNKIL